MFCTRTGTPIDAKHLTEYFKAMLKRAGLPDMRFHGCGTPARRS